MASGSAGAGVRRSIRGRCLAPRHPVAGSWCPAPDAGLAKATSLSTGPLADADAREALDVPAQQSDVRWETDALEAAVESAGGYPYALQLIGEATWEVAADGRIDLAAAEAGIAMAREELSALFAARWRELPDGERRYLAAFVAVPPDERTATAVAARLGRQVTQVATARSRLVHTRRLLREDDEGDLVLTLPGFEDWIRARSA